MYWENEVVMTELNKILHFSNAMLNAATLDDLLWSIADNIGEALGFDDCVVYLNVNGVLIQKAAFGIKNPKDRNLLNEIIISPGQGIVGVVAQSQDAEIIPDTTIDDRYIWDEFSGKSELTVPIIYEERTIGIIDSESTCYNNFTQNDKELLQVIANIAAPRIASAQYCSQLEKTQRQLEEANVELESSLCKLKENQNALIHTEKMASIGLLAAGVAHEINNPLGFSISNLGTFADYYSRIAAMHETLLNHPSLPNDLKQQLLSCDYTQAIEDIASLANETNDGLFRIKNIVADLCGYVRNEDKCSNEFDINTTIKSTLNLLRGEIDECCDLELNLGQLPHIYGNKSKIHQVFINIILNALQAIPKQGIIKIKTYLGNNYACIDITDNGVGINNENLKNIFTPFYTTKPIGEGTGLGLYICHRIIAEEHLGKINVFSNKNETTFRVMLPLIDGTSALKELNFQYLYKA